MNVLSIGTVLGTTLRTATPVILASLGGLVSLHAGIINVAMEGFMLIASFTAVLFSYYVGAGMGVVAAVVACVLFSLLYALFVVDLKIDGFAIGFALNILASALTLYLVRAIGADIFNSPELKSLPRLQSGLLANVPFLDAAFNGHSILVYAAPVLVLLMWWILYRTPFGLRLRAAGEAPRALESAGVSSRKAKYLASIICGIFCGLAGAHLSIGYMSQFIRDMTAGRGFMALAAILVGRGYPLYTALVALLFALAEALAIKLQALEVAPQFALMLPYLVTILTVVLSTSDSRSRRRKRVAADKGANT